MRNRTQPQIKTRGEEASVVFRRIIGDPDSLATRDCNEGMRFRQGCERTSAIPGKVRSKRGRTTSSQAVLSNGSIPEAFFESGTFSMPSIAGRCVRFRGILSAVCEEEMYHLEFSNFRQ